MNKKHLLYNHTWLYRNYTLTESKPLDPVGFLYPNQFVGLIESNYKKIQIIDQTLANLCTFLVFNVRTMDTFIPQYLGFNIQYTYIH